MVSAHPWTLRPLRKRQAFTLIELLAVITVILGLLGILLAIIPALRRSIQRAKTSSGIALILQAFESSAAKQSRMLAPVEHPLAGSAAPRPRFVRRNDPSDSTGTELDRDGSVFRAPRPGAIPDSHRLRLIEDTDVYADQALPLLYGSPRMHCRILGVTSPMISSWYDLPDLGMDRKWKGADLDDLKKLEPYGHDTRLFTWANTGFSREEDMAEDAWEKAGARFMEMALADNATELIQLGTLRTPDIGRDALILGGRVRLHQSEGTPYATSWEPGRVREGADWARYQLRGPALYDAWGHELLFRLTPAGNPIVESAGPDGVLRLSPGNDGIFDTSPLAEATRGDDVDGRADNVLVERQ